MVLQRNDEIGISSGGKEDGKMYGAETGAQFPALAETLLAVLIQLVWGEACAPAFTKLPWRLQHSAQVTAWGTSWGHSLTWVQVGTHRHQTLGLGSNGAAFCLLPRSG